ncbi:MAG TPA: alkaline phosphatase D family protein [Thermoleophilaceae bacterium]|nr:alkaline phosphatase D family protein [Thermoleophilaceae bacterium]
MELSRRQLLAAGAAAGTAIALDGAAVAAPGSRVVRRIDFAASPDGDGWDGWRCTGVANLRQAGGLGLIEAGSDVFPNDPRPVAFAVDARLRDGMIEATIAEPGSAPGVVLRRRSARSYYAVVYDSGRGRVRILRRHGADLDELASVAVPAALAPLVLTFEATGAHPTRLRAELVDAGGAAFSADARDGLGALQRAGDPGVLATAETVFPSEPAPVLPALGNLHLLPWAVQEGQAVMATELGQAVVAEIRRRSTAGFREVVVTAPGPARATRPSVVAAHTGPPVRGGAELHVAADLAARGAIELSYSPRFRNARRIPIKTRGGFQAASTTVRGLRPGRRVYWRARLRRGGRRTVGPVRSFRVPPRAGAERPFRIAVAACGSQFGPIFSHLAAARPDVLVWQGDLNYPDTHGPLAQTTAGYAGIWRDFLANPALVPVLERAAFAPQRDDHDYAVQDANSTNIADFPWGLAPWKALMNRRLYYRFPAGAAEVWVLDQRLFKSDPEAPDGPDKTLLGERQRRWLERTLARSQAAFKVICSPCTLFMPANSRDGNWATKFQAERDALLDHIDANVDGTTLFLTGDTHLTGVYDADGRIEVRAAPVGIPKPNDITLLDPLAARNLRGEDGVAYADDRCHLTLLEVRGGPDRPTLDLRLMREDGATPYERRFT